MSLWPIAKSISAGARMWPAWILGLALGTLGVALGGLRFTAVTNDSRALESQVEPRATATASPSVSELIAKRPDFTFGLRRQLPTPLAMTVLQRATSAAGVALSGVQAQPPVLAPSQLSRLELAVSMRGTYPAVKEVLAQVTGEVPGVTVHRLSLRKIAPPNELEAAVLLNLWAQPGKPERP